MPAENGDSLALGLTRAADSDKFHLWEKGLPNADDLVPLNQSLITPVLAHAFSIEEALSVAGASRPNGAGTSCPGEIALEFSLHLSVLPALSFVSCFRSAAQAGLELR